MARPRPFDFVSFDKTAAAEEPRAFSAGDLEAARAEGLAEGRRLAMESIAADDAAALNRIGDLLSASLENIDADMEKTRDDILTLARVFVEEFCKAIALEREIEAADSLLRQLTENSEDRRTARLFLPERRIDRIEQSLAALLSDRRIGDFVMIESDPHLKPGECRLEWRGGEIRRTHAEIEAAVAGIFDHQTAEKMEQRS
ncbi:MAG: hypothetical protein KDE05_10540 [Parvularculaceae bacterium]|nr:hypothetical protein [Parvularculaceae bacterium]